MNPPVALLELGLWPVRVEAAPLAMYLQDRLGGQLYQPWLNSEAGTSQSQRQQFALAYRRHRQWIMIGATGIAAFPRRPAAGQAQRPGRGGGR
jgi:cobalt-precorrin 5A hydrolase